MFEVVAKMFLEHGILGIVAATALWIAWKKDQALISVYERLISHTEIISTANRQIASGLESVIRRLERKEDENED